jgi:hypothetical protein
MVKGNNTYRVSNIKKLWRDSRGRLLSLCSWGDTVEPICNASPLMKKRFIKSKAKGYVCNATEASGPIIRSLVGTHDVRVKWPDTVEEVDALKKQYKGCFTGFSKAFNQLYKSEEGKTKDKGKSKGKSTRQGSKGKSTRQGGKGEQGSSTYIKSYTLSKQLQNQHIVDLSLHHLPKQPKEWTCVVLDSDELNTTKTLLKAGVQLKNIYIAQKCKKDALDMERQMPSLKILHGLLGQLIYKLACDGKKVDVFVGDYCGMAGRIGQAGSPCDDLSNLVKYHVLSPKSVVTMTMCARSNVKLLKKFEGFKRLKAQLRGNISHRFKLVKDYTYADDGCQTMCHVSTVHTRCESSTSS